MVKLTVDHVSYSDAAEPVRTQGLGVVNPAMITLMSSLQQCGGMAGSDSGGQSFASKYDSSAKKAVAAGCSLGTALQKMAVLISHAAHNHAAADAASSLKGRAAPASPATEIWPQKPEALPSASGGTGQTPDWWHYVVDHIASLVWPDADTGKLRSAGTAWDTAAAELDQVVTNCNTVKKSLQAQKSPEITQAVTALGKLSTAASNIAKAFRSLSKQCNDYAQKVDDAHQSCEDTMKEVLAGLAITAVVGIGLTLVTAGGSDVAAAAAASEEVAGAAVAVESTLTGCAAAAETAATTVGEAATTVAAEDATLATFEAAEPEVAEVASTSAEGSAESSATTAAEDSAAEDGVSESSARSASREESAQEEPGNCGREGEPVDVVTGRVYMATTDITLPGLLPLTLRRWYKSGYRLGRSFGPAWSSTLDERLEFDDQGAVLVREDGSLLTYPAPVEDADVIPEKGTSRWALRRLADGAFQVREPLSGRVRRYEKAGVSGDAYLMEITDRAGRWIRFLRDSAGTPTAVLHHGGYHLSLAGDGGRVTRLDLVETVAGEAVPVSVMTYEYTDGHLTQVVSADADAGVRFEYDERARMVRWTDSNGVAYTHVYDGQDRCVSQSGSGGAMAYLFDYSGRDAATGDRITTVTNSLGAQIRYFVNRDARVSTIVDPLGGVTEKEYSARGDVVRQRDPDGGVTRWEYDDRGAVTAVHRPGGVVTRVVYDEAGLPVQAVDPTGAVTGYTYDDAGQRTSRTDALGGTHRITWNPAGLPEAVTDPLGHTTRLVCDPTGLVRESVNALGARTEYVRDSFGRLVRQTDALGQVTAFTWSAGGRLTSRTAPDGARDVAVHDAEGNIVRRIDAAGRVTRYEYGPFDQVTARVDPDGTRLEFTYDTELRLTSVRNQQGLVWTYRRDLAGRVVAETDYDGRTTTYLRDGLGRVVRTTYPDGTSQSITYDAADQMVAVAGEGIDARFAHDAAGRLLSAVTGDVELSRELDVLGRVTAETVDGSTMRWEYDAAGNVVRRQTPAGIESVWSYDAAGDPVGLTMGGHRLDLERDLLGQEIRRSVGDGTGPVLESSWTPTGRLASRGLVTTGVGLGGEAHDEALRAWGVSYEYAPTGELLATDDSALGRRTNTLDGLGRITAVIDGAGARSQEYAYDSAGNLTEAIWSGRDDEGPAAPAGERRLAGTSLLTAGRDRFTYDARGRVVERRRRLLSGGSKVWSFSWDGQDRLVSLVNPEGETWRYRYDALGRRVSKQRDGDNAPTSFSWDGATLVERRGLGTAVTWEHNGLTPFAQVMSKGEALDTAGHLSQAEVDVRFEMIVTDFVGAPTRVVAPDGATTWVARPTVWGERPAADEDVMPLAFPGQYVDSESGLHYNVFRYYDPATARFLTQDPLGLAPSPNPVMYPVNPTTHIDPLGLMGCEEGEPGRLEDGPNGTKRDPKTGRFTRDPDKHEPTVRDSAHGNSRMSQKLTWLYRLLDPDGNLVKWGISSNPAARYTQRELGENVMVKMTNGLRDKILNLERWLVENDPGPLNREPWAGSGDGSWP